MDFTNSQFAFKDTLFKRCQKVPTDMFLFVQFTFSFYSQVKYSSEIVLKNTLTQSEKKMSPRLTLTLCFSKNSNIPFIFFDLELRIFPLI